VNLVLGTATPGGGFPVYGEAVAAAIRDVDPSLSIETRPTKGSTENVPLARRLPQARETTAASTVAAAPRIALLHPGERRYLREVGLLG
jgi:TRAP-type uncharacterized transport system substrate-binding protein